MYGEAHFRTDDWTPSWVDNPSGAYRYLISTEGLLLAWVVAGGKSLGVVQRLILRFRVGRTVLRVECGVCVWVLGLQSSMVWVRV